MTASMWHSRTGQKVALALIVSMGAVDSAFAVPPTLNSSGLSPQQCYRRDSDCTQFCGEVSGDMRYECFGICDRMLDNCLETGDWSDSAQIDPGTGKPPDKRDQLLALNIRMMMVLADTDGDGVLTPKEIQSVRERVFEKVDAKGGPRKPGNPPNKP
jgi:hypothetical protein